MNAENKIIAAIKSRGWFTMEVYFSIAQKLAADGIIKRGERFSTGGNRQCVWIAA